MRFILSFSTNRTIVPNRGIIYHIYNGFLAVKNGFKQFCTTRAEAILALKHN